MHHYITLCSVIDVTQVESVQEGDLCMSMIAHSYQIRDGGPMHY